LGLFRDLKLDGPAGLSLNDAGAVSYLAVNANVVNVQPHEAATAQLAVDGEIEQCKVAPAPLKLEPNAGCPDLLRFQRAFLANQLALVPWASRKAHQGGDRGVHDSLLDPNRARRSAGIH
jgi:hypothetical protein